MYKPLTEEQVKQNRDKYGRNVIPEPEPPTFVGEFIDALKDPMLIILLVIVGLMLVMYFLGYSEIFEPVGTFITIMIVAFVTAKTSISSDTKYRALKNSVKKDTCRVRRSSGISEIEQEDLVVGDIVNLQPGDKVPGDGFLTSGKVSVDNSVLNGEVEPAKKVPGSSFPQSITGETFVDDSSIFKGSLIIDGEGEMYTSCVGTDTVMGKMALDMQDAEVMSPLKVKLAKLASQISKFGYIGATIITIMYCVYFVMNAGGLSSWCAQGAPGIIQDIVKAVSLAVVIVVCAVPEGLPLMISIVLMQNTSRMLDKNVLVRKAIGIETAGSLNILFSDKTGTITQGHLSVVKTLAGNGKSVSQSLQNEISKIISINTSATYSADGEIVGGNMTDKALIATVSPALFDKIREKNKVIASQGFNSTNKFCQSQIDGRVIYTGAPERLIEKAKYYLAEDGKEYLFDRKVMDEIIDEFARQAMRVLAFGYSTKEMVENEIHDDIVLVGVVAIRDDVRKEAADAIAEVQQAGIQVVMITGDRLETARAIAVDAGLIREESDIAITSAELNNMSDEEVKAIVKNIRVIARALPTDKSRMVRICQEMNLVVGMTGDGVNDAPALKRADVGFAMGSGTEAAKEAGKIVILDDNFRSIKDAILYGRTIYHNILTFCKFQLAINVTAVIVSALSPFLGIEEPLKVTHLLFVNLVMDSLGAIMLGNEPAKAKYMLEAPRRRDENIISTTMRQAIASAAVFMIAASFMFLTCGIVWYANEAQHLTGYFIMFIAMALFNGFNVRDDGLSILNGLGENPNFLRIMVAIFVAQMCLVYIPGVNTMFSCTPVNLFGLGAAVCVSAMVIPFDLIRKMLFKREA